ncbi:MAG: sigma-70 family RNA polymerase sigma factor [Clostridia bacterium]|nr:sigma-70 family RNA polymerase sigma factor [Clostridia bacterium]MBQ8325071.1 sigma-70 family RNA polymerase sigma factor [Clostridia bacterium]
MIKVFYIEDTNGQYVSADGSKRWTRLTGQALYDFLQTERGKKTYFFVDTDDSGIAIGVEITDKEQQIAFETDKRRRRYVSDSQKESGYITVSFDYVETEDGASTGDEVIPNDDDSIEDDVLRQFDLETLRRALDTLTEDEYALICALFLQDNPLTTRDYAKQLGVQQTTVMRAKKRILEKLRNFF